MKTLILLLSYTFCSVTLCAQDLPVVAHDTLNIPPNALRILAEVISADDHMAVLKVERVVGHGHGVITMPNQGDDVTVRIPGRNKPEAKTKIEVDIKEKIDIGATPSSYILLTFRRVE